MITTNGWGSEAIGTYGWGIVWRVPVPVPVSEIIRLELYINRTEVIEIER